MHDDQWEGQHWNRAPGTLYSSVEKVRIIEKVNPTLNPESAAAVTTVNNATLTKAPSFRQEKAVAQFTPGVSSGGDKVSVRYGQCDCGHQGPTIGYDIVRYADLGDGDKITCAGTIDAYVRGVS